jgi:hypothetical protein
MSKLLLICSLVLMVPGWAMLGGFARLDSPESRSVVGGMVVGGLIGVFFGLVLGGLNGKWLDYVFGPESPGDRTE